MRFERIKILYKKIALALSLIGIVVWGVLGTGTSLAWFADTSPEINNIFHFADFELKVSQRLDNGNWEKVDSQTEIFDNEALYEPGYTQVVYLKIENKGDCDFQFDTAVSVNGYVLATNVFGNTFNLQDYLQFGLVIADSEQKLDEILPAREQAAQIATQKLNNYYKVSDVVVLAPDEASYMAIVVRMPEEVTNIANYRGDTAPQVELGVIIKAEQIKK